MIKRIMKGLLAVCCALTMVSIQGVYAAEGEPVIIDEIQMSVSFIQKEMPITADGDLPMAAIRRPVSTGATRLERRWKSALKEMCWRSMA
ncbi:MAG: hypothetical protein V8T10_08815 [Merdibacter sp.]